MQYECKCTKKNGGLESMILTGISTGLRDICCRCQDACQVRFKVPMMQLHVQILFEKATFSRIKYLHDNATHDFTHTDDIFITKCDNLK